jgi:hypothetical protein
MCGLGAVDASSIFGLVRRTGAFPGGLLTFSLVSGFQLAEHNCGKCHFFTVTSSSRREVMVDGTLVRSSVLRVGLGVGGAVIASGLCTRLSYSCDGWVCGLGAVGDSLIFGLVRGSGVFRCGASDFCFSFKNAAHAAQPCQ